MHEFDTYINSITGRLSINKKKKDELYEEFMDHLQMLKQNNIMSGMNEDDAIKEAIKCFGNNNDLKLKLSTSTLDYRTISNILFGIFFTILIFWMGSRIPMLGLSIIDDIGFAVLVNVFFGFIAIFIPLGYFLPIIFKKVNKVQNVSLASLLLSPIMGIILSISLDFIQTGFIISSIAGGLSGSALGFTILVMVNKVVYKYRYS